MCVGAIVASSFALLDVLLYPLSVSHVPLPVASCAFLKCLSPWLCPRPSFLSMLLMFRVITLSGATMVMILVQGLVSRDKLLDMKRHAEMAHEDSSDRDIFSAVKWRSLLFSVLVRAS